MSILRPGVVFAAGAAVGVYGVVKVRRIAEAFTPDGMRDRLGAAVLGARLLAEEVAQGQAEAEIRLREQYRAMQDAARRNDSPAALAAPSTDPARRSAVELEPRSTTTASTAAHTQEGHH